MKLKGRCLTSKRMRALLYLEAGGRCQLCGVELPENWHADHVTPWVVTGRTNVHDMQALCPKCNLKKGATHVKLRRHQAEFRKIIAEIKSGSPVRKVVSVVTPGGGKSLLPVITSNELISVGFADFVAWVVPRLSLAVQAESEFSENRLGLNVQNHLIRHSTNDLNPCRGLNGFTTTYNAVVSDASGSGFPRTLVDMFDSSRGILVLDECHHIKDGGAFHSSLRPLIDRAALTVYMSGNLTRGDGLKVGELPYTESGEIDYLAEGWAFVRYSRQDALKDRAKLPIDFAHLDGAAKWIDAAGNKQSVDTLESTEFAGQSLFAAIQTEYADQLLDACMLSFEARRTVNPRAKMLVVVFSIKEAKRIKVSMSGRGQTVGIAVSKHGDVDEESLKSIARFKKHGRGSYDILVTVQMAYEGLDVPSITHIACLTHIRSWPWLEQLFDRGTRIDPKAGPYETQSCTIYVPRDPMMAVAIAKIRAAQGEAARDAPPEEIPEATPVGSGGGTPPDDLTPGNDIIPLTGMVTETSYTSDQFESVIEVGAAASRKISEAMTASGMLGTPLEFIKAAQSLGISMSSVLSTTNEGHPKDDFRLGDVTPSQEEDLIRRCIQNYCSKVDQIRGGNFGMTNGMMVKHFGKGRPEMDLLELRQAWKWLQRKCPIREAQ